MRDKPKVEPAPEYLQLAAQWRDQLGSVTEEHLIFCMTKLFAAHTPEGFDALMESRLEIAGEPVWLFMLSAAEFVLITHNETMRGVRA